jgi:hypothetical protein
VKISGQYKNGGSVTVRVGGDQGVATIPGFGAYQNLVLRLGVQTQNGAAGTSANYDDVIVTSP